MKESLRMYPPGLSIPKVATTNCEIIGSDGTAYYIPKDAIINLEIQAMQMNPLIFPNPNEFQPNRWIPKKNDENIAITGVDTNISKASSASSTTRFDEVNDISNFAAFSLGGRSCIGRRFAQIEIIVTLAMISMKYQIFQPAGVTKEELLEVKHVLTISPKNDIGLIFKERSSF